MIIAETVLAAALVSLVRSLAPAGRGHCFHTTACRESATIKAPHRATDAGPPGTAMTGESAAGLSTETPQRRKGFKERPRRVRAGQGCKARPKIRAEPHRFGAATVTSAGPSGGESSQGGRATERRRPPF
jgi:hypothetical protein